MNLPPSSDLAIASIMQSKAPALNTAARLDARKTAQDFEAFFLSQVVESMYAGIKTDGPFGGGQAELIFRSLQTQEYAKSMAGSSGIGIADAVYREILRLQEESMK